LNTLPTDDAVRIARIAEELSHIAPSLFVDFRLPSFDPPRERVRRNRPGAVGKILVRQLAGGSPVFSLGRQLDFQQTVQIAEPFGQSPSVFALRFG
jgi:hypothetical protein